MKEEVAHNKLKNIMLAFSLIGSCFDLTTLILMGVYDLTGFNLSPSTNQLCNSYLTNKYELSRYSFFSAAFLLQLFSLFLSTAAFIFLIVKRQPRKGYMYRSLWSCLNMNCLVVLYVLFSCAVLGCGSSTSYYLALMVQKGNCLDNILMEWALVFALGLIAFLLLLTCWFINLWLVHKERQLSEVCSKVDEISFGCDNPTYFQNFHQQHEDNGPILQRKTNPVRQNSAIKQLKNNLQQIKRSIPQNSNSKNTPDEERSEFSKVDTNTPSKTDREKDTQQKNHVDKVKVALKESFVDDGFSSDAGSPRNNGRQGAKGDKVPNSSANSNNKTAILDNSSKNAPFSPKSSAFPISKCSQSPKNVGNSVSRPKQTIPKSPKHPQSARKQQSNSNDSLNSPKFLASISYNKLPSAQPSQDQTPSPIKKTSSEHKFPKQPQPSPAVQNPYNKFIKEDEIKQEELQLLIFSKMSEKIEDSLVYEKKRNYGENRNKLFSDMLPEPKQDRWDKRRGENANKQVDQQVINHLRQKFLG